MCTVTYLPISKSSFILTHNRDEHYTRSVATMPQLHILNDKEVAFPIDIQGGGTWFATSKTFTLCLLNGGFEKHIPKPPYKHSRGLVILDFFKSSQIESFFEGYSFDGIEPFTLLIVNHITGEIHELVNDGERIYHSVKDHSVAHIWSSTTLYSKADQAKRKKWFDEWCLQQHQFTQESILTFHQQKYDDVENEGIQINRNNILYTVSSISVYKNETNKMRIRYEDLIQQKHNELVF